MDPDHSAVVALLDSREKLICTGTLIAASAARGVVLTAAHCLADPITLVVVGAEYRGESRHTYPIAATLAHPDFERTTGSFDFGVAFLPGPVAEVSAQPLSPQQDQLAVGDAIEFVGYGRDSQIAASAARKRVTGTVSEITATTFRYQQTQGGPCEGDSGGPVFITLVGGSTFVAGVNSYGDPQCTEYGVSGRVSVARSFLASVLSPEESDCPDEIDSLR